MSVEDSDLESELQTLFAEALELDPSQRAGFLDNRCMGRAALRAELESLIDAHDRSDRFLDLPVSAAPDPPDTEVLRDQRGRTVGQFRLLEAIGEGGMGVVYRAERLDGAFTQRVAVKLIDLPLRHPDALRRFRAERQILATLSHANIVMLVDAGVAEDGQAYLVMELIDGVSITAYCRERGLSLVDRLRLFRDVCGAVQHAHQHGVVHRDLKPGNILVTAGASPKILDFGVAKLTASEGHESEATMTSALRPLTPNYASPEQVRGLPVTTVSDIYALGVLLYELLTGVRPYETAGKTVDDILRIVGDEDPPRPSVRQDGGGTGLPYDRDRLRGDLDAIVLKAMSKDPARRYASAQELAEDVTRHLGGRPVLAREPSFGYVAVKMARRHRAAFLAATFALIALVSALGVSLWQMRIATAERNRATERFNQVRQLANALIFKIHDQVQPLPGSTAVRQSIVEQALTYLEHLSRDPSGDDGLRLELAKAYQRVGAVQGSPSVPNLGDRKGALTSFTKAMDLLRPMAFGPTASREAAITLAETALWFAVTAGITGAREEALAATREAASIADEMVRRDPSDADGRRLAASALFQLALQTRGLESLPIWQQAADAYAAILAEQPNNPDHQRNVALVEKYRADIYTQQGDFKSSLFHHRRALLLDEQRLAVNPTDRQVQFDVAIALGGVASGEWRAGRLTEAAAAYERSVAIRAKLVELDKNDTQARGRLAFARSRLALVEAERGRMAPALMHARLAVEIGESVGSVDHESQRQFANILTALGRVEALAGRDVAACRAYRRAQAVVTELGVKSGSVSAYSGIVNDVERGLAACEPRPPGVASARNP